MQASNYFVTDTGELLLYSAFFNSCFKVIGYKEVHTPGFEVAILPLCGVHDERLNP